MDQTSLNVMDRFVGEALIEAHAAAMHATPEEQILELFTRLNDGWT